MQNPKFPLISSEMTSTCTSIHGAHWDQSQFFPLRNTVHLPCFWFILFMIILPPYTSFSPKYSLYRQLGLLSFDQGDFFLSIFVRFGSKKKHF